MDTRSKIFIPGTSLAHTRGARVTAYLAYFDPLQAAHIRCLSGLVAPDMTIVAIVLNPADPLLPLRARAELVAALDIIDFVIPVEDDPGPLLDRLAPARIVHDEREDSRRTDRLIAHVRARYQ